MESQRYESRHGEVQDFDWVRGGASPNWRSLGADEVAPNDEDYTSLDSEEVDVDALLARLLPQPPHHG